MKKQVGQIVCTAAGLAFLCLAAMAAPVLADPANPGIRVVDPQGGWPGAVSLGQTDFIPYGEHFETVDPNFKQDGITGYTGIRIAKILDLAGVAPVKGLTIVGSDQYVGYLPLPRLSQGFLVWEMGGRPVQAVNGGPLKVIFPETAGVHGSCYTWYVDTLVPDRIARARLRVRSGGRAVDYDLERLMPHARKLDPGLVSIAQGCRNEFPGRQGNGRSPGPVLAVTLNRLIPAPRHRVTLIPGPGARMVLDRAVFDFPVYLLFAQDGQPLHPALGGPFSVVFPVEEHPELAGMVPESGALFFLEQIVVD